MLNSATGCSEIEIYTEWSSVANIYVDAIGIDGVNYTTGDNLQEEGCEGTSFEGGVNCIVIPTELFKDTLLHGYVESERLNETTLWSEDEDEFNMISVERDGKYDDSSAMVDWVFTRSNITASQAMEILELLLTCVVNETLDENNNTLVINETLYTYVSTKHNGTKATQLNLHEHALGYITWINVYKSAEQGKTPAGQAFWTKMNFVGFLGWLLWLIVRVILLIIFYILLAIEILTIVPIFIMLGLALTVASLVSVLSCNWGINIFVPYAKTTKIGYVDIEISDITLSIEAKVVWIYWKFFKLHIPVPTFNFDMDAEIDEPSNETKAPTLHCGYTQVGESNSTQFRFYTTYRDVNDDEPEYVKLNLIAPNGTVNEYNMSKNELYNGSVVMGFEYNITIDFAGKDSGQWFYYFNTKEDSEDGFETKWPSDYYCEPGPFISQDGLPEDYYSYFLYSDVNKYSGFYDEMYNFTVTGADFLKNALPDNVSLNFLWSNGTMQAFTMTEQTSYTFEVGVNETLRNVTLITYVKSMNFSHFIEINDTFVVRAYYSAEFSDGNVSILFDGYEDKYYNEDDELLAKKWFERPTIIPRTPGGAPVILGWRIEEIATGLSLSPWGSLDRQASIIGPIIDEQVLRFWVYIADPDGDHQQHLDQGFVFKPELVLTKFGHSYNSSSGIEMAWAGKGYGPYPEVDAYFVDILPTGSATFDYEDFIDFVFGPGAWTFKFNATDDDGNSTIISPNRKIWNIGSGTQMWFTALNGYSGFGGVMDKLIPGAGMVESMIVSGAFLAAGLASMAGPTGRTIARVISTGIVIYSLVTSLVGYGMLATSDDTGALLGLAISSLITAAGSALAYGISKLPIAKGIDKLAKSGAKLAAKLTMYALLVSLILSILCNPTVLLGSSVIGNGDYFMIFPGTGNEFDWDFPGEDIIRAVPLQILGFFISILSMGAILNIASSRDVNIDGISGSVMGSCPVVKMAKFFTIIKVALSAMCFISFMINTGTFIILGDLLAERFLNL